MRRTRKTYVYVVIHTFAEEVQVEVCKTNTAAWRIFKSILQTYADEGDALDPNAKSDAELFRLTGNKLTIESREVWT